MVPPFSKGGLGGIKMIPLPEITFGIPYRGGPKIHEELSVKFPENISSPVVEWPRAGYNAGKIKRVGSLVIGSQNTADHQVCHDDAAA
jgi:hypothetical protein